MPVKMFPVEGDFAEMSKKVTELSAARSGEKKLKDVLEGVEIFTQVVLASEHIKDNELTSLLGKTGKAKGLAFSEKEDDALQARVKELLYHFHRLLGTSQSEAMKLLRLLKGIAVWQPAAAQEVIKRIGAETDLLLAMQEYCLHPAMEVDIAKMMQADGALKRLGKVMRCVTKAEKLEVVDSDAGADHFRGLLKFSLDVQTKVKGVLLSEAESCGRRLARWEIMAIGDQRRN